MKKNKTRFNPNPPKKVVNLWADCILKEMEEKKEAPLPSIEPGKWYEVRLTRFANVSVLSVAVGLDSEPKKRMDLYTSHFPPEVDSIEMRFVKKKK
jgi:hypothetical protein